MSNRLSIRLHIPLACFLAVLAILSAGLPAKAADPRLAGYHCPDGWKVEIAATEPLVINPVTMTFGLDGRLYVVEWMPGDGPNDRIRVLSDVDGDGTFDRSDNYMDHLELPAGLLFWDGWTYLTLGHDVVRLKDKDGDGTFETREVIVSGFGNDNSHHRVSGLSMGPEGWIYMTTGDSDARVKGSDGSAATVLRSGGVFRCRPDGKDLEVVAFGMRNPWGNVAFDDEFHIFHTDNDNEGTAGFTGCRILHVVEGGDYGWRLREGARCCAPDFERATWNGGRPGRLGWVAETGRGAPAGLCVLNSAAFPPSTRNLLVYPDVFRKLVRAYKLRPKGATYEVAEEFPLLTSDDPLFRPDDAEVGTDGALYVLDWRTDSGGAGQLQGNGSTGRIYRLTWAGTKQEPSRPTLPADRFAGLGAAKDEALIAALDSADYVERRAASLELIRRGQNLANQVSALLERRVGPGTPKDSKPRPDQKGPASGEEGKALQELKKEREALDQLRQVAAKLDNQRLVLESDEAEELTSFCERITDSVVLVNNGAPAQSFNRKIAILGAMAQSRSKSQRVNGLFEKMSGKVPRGFENLVGAGGAEMSQWLPSSAVLHEIVWSGIVDLGEERPGNGGGRMEVSLGLLRRFGNPGDPFDCLRLLESGCPKDPRSARAWALALGSYNGLRRKTDGENTDPFELIKAHQAGAAKRKEKGAANGLGGSKPKRKANRRGLPEVPILPDVEFEGSLSTDLLARRLIALAVEHRTGDPFLRDGITRALEHLGPASIEALVALIKTGNATERDIALFALEGWRNDDAVGTILLEATAETEIPAADRANLFRALREMIDRVAPDPIAAWLDRARGAAPEARVEAVRLVAAMHQRSFLAAGPVLPGLLEDQDGSVRRAALELASNVHSNEAKRALIALVKNTNRSGDERRLALSALRGYEDKSLASMLGEQLSTAEDAGFQAELLRTVAAIDSAAATKMAQSLLDSKAREVRQEAIGLLGQRPATALLVVERFNAGRLPSEDLPRVIEAIRPHATPELQSALQALLRRSLLSAPTSEDARKLREAVARHGNAERGREIYLDSKKGGCTVCHRMEGTGGSVGPDLTKVWETLSFEKRVESILEPSKEIKEGYQTFKVALKDGRTVSGLLLSDTPEAVTLKDTQGREVRIPAAEVEEKGTDKVSLMPAGSSGTSRSTSSPTCSRSSAAGKLRRACASRNHDPA